MKALIADDDPVMRDFIAMVLQECGLSCVKAENGREALALFCSERPDIVLLDVMMPKADGFEVCTRIRLIDPDVPVLFLSAKGDVVDRKTGLRMGADDYLAKPFDEEELALRVKALLRRRQSSIQPKNGLLQVGDFVFDQKKMTLEVNGREVCLTAKEFQIMFVLAMRQGEAVSTTDLIREVWGNEYEEDAISIRVYVRRIRGKIEDDPSHPKHLRTFRGRGYLFEP